MERPLRPGDLLQKEDGTIAMLIERVDMFQASRIASRNYRPLYYWRIKSLGLPQDHLYYIYEMPEQSILAGKCGKILL